MATPRFRPGVELPADQLEANRLYWETDASVNGIAESMGVSKGRLYDLLLPLDVAAACPACGSPLGYPHRTARVRGVVGCDRCAFEGALDDLPSAGEGADGHPRPEPDEEAVLHWAPGGYGDPLGRQRTVIGAALLGMAAGLVIGGWLRRS
jgi:hypothetical protein